MLCIFGKIHIYLFYTRLSMPTFLPSTFQIDKILIEKNAENENKYLSEIKQKMIIDNEFILKYKLGEVGILRIFGEPFVAKNKNNFNMLINGETYKLSSTIKIIDIETGKSSNNIIKIQKSIWNKIRTIYNITYT